MKSRKMQKHVLENFVYSRYSPHKLFNAEQRKKNMEIYLWYFVTRKMNN